MKCGTIKTNQGKSSKAYSKGRLARQTVDGSLIDYEYTRRGQLAGKYLGGKLKPDAAVEYEYSPAGQITARTANGVRQTYEYDRRGQLLAVKEGGADIERYAYDKAGNMLRKTVNGKTTTFTFDDANQLVSSTTDGVTTRYEYDAAGRLVKEGNRTYTYGYLDKVLSVSDGKNKFTYTYHPDGWNAFVYCNNGVTASVDLWGCVDINYFDKSSVEWMTAGNFDRNGRITVSGHGSQKGILDDDSRTLVSVSDLVDRIKDTTDYKSGIKVVELASCHVGNGTYAQEVVNMLEYGFVVYAPDCYASYDNDTGEVTYYKEREQIPWMPETYELGNLLRFVKE